MASTVLRRRVALLLLKAGGRRQPEESSPAARFLLAGEVGRSPASVRDRLALLRLAA